jgi:hypothetical protein
LLKYKVKRREQVMTEQRTVPRNKVVIVGVLDTVRQRVRDEERRGEARVVYTTIAEGRTPLRGAVDRFTMQLVSPFGEPFALPLELAPGVTGSELLHQATAGQLLVVEGELRQRTSVDSRYARSTQDPGRQVQELKLRVTNVRTPLAEEPITSAVWLEGTVTEPPRLVRDSEDRSVQLALTVIAVAQDGSATVYPGSRFGFKRQVRVQVGVPVAIEHAALLFKPGNQVRIEGQVDCMIFTQGGAVVDQTVAQLDAEFAQREQQGFKSDQQRNEAVRAYRRRRQQLLSAARPFVMVGYVDALSDEAGQSLAEPISLDEALERRREFAADLRRRRAEREARRAEREARAIQELNAADQREVGDGSPVASRIVDILAPRAPAAPIPPLRRPHETAVAASAVTDGVEPNSASDG